MTILLLLLLLARATYRHKLGLRRYPMIRVRILILNAAVGPLDYRVKDGQDVPLGSFVTVPLGPRQVLGVAWEKEKLAAPDIGAEKLRAVQAILPAPPLSFAMRRLMEWTAQYYCAPLSAVVRMAGATESLLRTTAMVTEYRLSGTAPARMTPKRAQAIDALAGKQANLTELAEDAGVSQAVLRGLANEGVLEAIQIDSTQPYPRAKPDFLTVELNPSQSAAAAQISAQVTAGAFTPFLLDGVTGSGKTEVYFEAVAEALRDGRQALVLLPEIALTESFLARFAARFGASPVPWHSALKASERRRAWYAIAHGEAQVIIGARSALFLPYANLGLIVVDEAHETSFKQDDGVRYNARDVAVMRARYESIPVVLASATPALESVALADSGVYTRLELSQRYGGAQLPAIRIIDIGKDQPERGQWIAPPLIDALRQRFENGEQSLLFLNRRGYAPLTLCRHCGYRFQCAQCSAWLVEHRFSGRLSCHHCGFETMPSSRCPECGEADCLVACGPGVERIAEEAAMLLPDARIALATSDTLNSAEHAAEFIARMEAGAIDVIVGTQLVAKGFHFPNLTFVGVIDADLGLEGGDLRAAERTYQQIAQVAGRAGRSTKPGDVFIQTRHPNAPVIAALASGAREAFYAAETEARKAAGAPPFGRWATIIISGEDEGEVRDFAHKLSALRPQLTDIAVLGPAPAPMALLRGRYRFRFILSARRSAPLQQAIQRWVSQIKLPRNIRLGVDIDPHNFM